MSLEMQLGKYVKAIYCIESCFKYIRLGIIVPTAELCG
jgi:hypothetical protein